MFVYIDESGNTGTHILDHRQPHFWYLAIMTRFDFHERYGRQFVNLALRQGYDYIHASASRSMDNDFFCTNVLQLIQNEELSFALVLIDKRAHAATLFYDYFMENNPGMPTYEPILQAIWRAAICELMDDMSQDLFWHKCVNAKGQNESDEALLELIRYFIGRFDIDPEIRRVIDPRMKELFTDSLRWAENNPIEYSQFIQRKVDRLKNSPTVMAYVELLKMVRCQMEVWNPGTCTVTHDNSEQFEKALRETHSAFCPDIPMQFSLSKDSAGLQLCDLCLSVVRRDALELPISRSQEALHDLIYLGRERQYFLLTQQTLRDEAQKTLEWVNSLPVSDADMDKGWRYMKEEDTKRLQRIKR